MDRGLVHLYWGDGKGKTTAAMGLALRFLGQGLRVTVVQFLKSGRSGELNPLRQLGAAVSAGKAGTAFALRMTEEERRETRRLHDENLRLALESGCDLLILDEVCAACRLHLVDRELVRCAVLDRPLGREVVLTGRDPAEWMREAADYCTELRCEKHPYQRGISARRGVEY